MKYHCVKQQITEYYRYKSPAPGYRELSQITTSGSTNITTGIKANSNLTMVFDFIPNEVQGGVILGHYDDGDSADYRFFKSFCPHYKFQFTSNSINTINNIIIL